MYPAPESKNGHDMSGMLGKKFEKLSPHGVIIRIRAGLPITTATVDKICELLDCQPNDIMEHKKEERD